MKNTTLMERAQDRVALFQLIEETGGELTPALETWLSEIETGLAEKVDKYKFALDELEVQAERLRGEAQAFSNAARSLERLRDTLSDRIKMTMRQLGQDELKGSAYRFKLSSRQSKLVTNEKDLPETYFLVKTIVEPDKARIKEALLAGAEIPGATLEESHQLRTYINKGA